MLGVLIILKPRKLWSLAQECSANRQIKPCPRTTCELFQRSSENISICGQNRQNLQKHLNFGPRLNLGFPWLLKGHPKSRGSSFKMESFCESLRIITYFGNLREICLYELHLAQNNQISSRNQKSLKKA
jgi:hypothetical protein